MKVTPIAIACSGLGRIHRGNETWARLLAEALHRSGMGVTLCGGGRLQTACPYRRIAHLPRDCFLIRPWISWHYRYWLEQITFEMALRRLFGREPHAAAHVPDPVLALRLRRHGARVIYKDGLLLGPSWCGQFEFVQVLAPYYLECADREGLGTEHWYVIPHFVDIQQYQPRPDRSEIRARILGDDGRADVFVILAVGDLSAGANKRLDWILQECAGVPSSFLLVAGHARPHDIRRFQRQAAQAMGDRVRVLANVAPAQMAEVYPAADLFVHAALREPFGIVFLEAMASGLPVIGHDYAVTRWIIGEAGAVVNMTAAGQLRELLLLVKNDRELRHKLGRRARERAVGVFSAERIVPLYQNMYQEILTG